VPFTITSECPLAGSLDTRRSLLLRLEAAPDDNAAWEEFVRIYGPHVARWCRSHGLQHADAVDVSQDVLVRFWRQAGTFRYDPARRFRGYLRQILVSAISDWNDRRRGGEPLRCGETAAALMASIPAREDLVARIEKAYDTELLEIAMREVKARVQPHTWEAFCLLALEGRPASDVSERLGLEINTAYVARSKVQRMIRAAVDRLGGAGGTS
jgi:RNA polymerase sigma factor (sigma-70 family)